MPRAVFKLLKHSSIAFRLRELTCPIECERTKLQEFV